MLEKRGRFSVVFRNDSLKTKITLHCTLRIFFFFEKRKNRLPILIKADFQNFGVQMATKYTIDLAGCFPDQNYVCRILSEFLNKLSPSKVRPEKLTNIK